MGDFDTILRCSYGGTVLPVTLVDWDHGTSVVTPGKPARRAAITCDAWIDATDYTDLQAKIEAVVAALSVAGKDFKIFEGSVVQGQILAADCKDGGPHVDINIDRGLTTAAGVKAFKFSVSGETASDDSYQESIVTRPDGLREITRTGEVSELDGVTFEASALAAFLVAYPRTLWIHSHKIDRDVPGSSVKYSLQARELRDPLPAIAGNMTDLAVEGTGTYRVERDEQMRLSTTWDFNLLMTGDYAQMLAYLRLQVTTASGLILSESYQVTLHTETRLSASFRTLKGGNGNALTAWSQRLALTGNDTTFGIRQYIGPDPILVRNPKTIRRLVQSGSAEGIDAYIKAPPPLYPDDLLEAPNVEYAWINETVRQTSWTYVMAIDEDPSVDSIKRPTSIDFYGPPPGGTP